MRDFVDDDGRTREARDENIPFLEKLEFARICTVIKSKYPPVRLALPLRYEPPPDAENPTAFAWEIDGKKIDKSDLTVKKHP